MVVRWALWANSGTVAGGGGGGTVAATRIRVVRLLSP
jgi:hypothetical protein